jgi:hypothetical protein
LGTKYLHINKCTAHIDYEQKYKKIYDEDLSINRKEIGGNGIVILSFLYNMLLKRLISN